VPNPQGMEPGLWVGRELAPCFITVKGTVVAVTAHTVVDLSCNGVS